PFAGIAQQLSPEQQEKYEALKVAFLTEELSLSSKEAQTFWPVYNEMDEKLTEIRQAKRKNVRKARKNFDSMSDAELEKVVTDALDLTGQEISTKREYLAQFKSVLPMKKVAKLYASEEKFKRRLLQKMKEQRRN
ncbi:MAG: hypothetical protein ACI9P8_001975, partial [Bacteroidia bacterium]